MELGTPQGSVLGPTIFTVLKNATVNTEFCLVLLTQGILTIQ